MINQNILEQSEQYRDKLDEVGAYYWAAYMNGYTGMDKDSEVYAEVYPEADGSSIIVFFPSFYHLYSCSSLWSMEQI